MKKELMVVTTGLIFASLAQAQVDFLPPTTFSTGKSSASITSGNFNGNKNALGYADLATTNNTPPQPTSGAVVLINNSGSFPSIPTSTPSSGEYPNFIIQADLDNDGDLDLATANTGVTFGSITIQINNGSGSFTPFTFDITTQNPKPWAIVTLDFDHDGDLDLATVNREDGVSMTVTGSVSIFRNELPSGTTVFPNPSTAFTYLAAPTFSAILVGANSQNIASGDLDGDNFDDLVTSNFGDQTISILRGDGIGNFSAFPSSPLTTTNGVGQGVRQVYIGDLVGNSALDLAVVNDGPNTVSIFTGDGTGGFTKMTNSPFPVGANPNGITAIDINKDGHTDLAIGNRVGKSVSILMNVEKTDFDHSTSPILLAGLPGTDGPLSITSADFNNDQRNDLATVNGNSISILLNDTTPSSVENLYLNSESIFPNPTNGGQFTIKLKKIPDGKSWIEVLNKAGSVVHKIQNIGLTNNVQLPSNLAKGMYLVVLKNSRDGRLAANKLMYE